MLIPWYEYKVSCLLKVLGARYDVSIFSMLTFPDISFEGYLFDCDGTLAHSMPVHYWAWQEALRKHGASYPFPEELFYQWGGKATVLIVELLNQRYGSSLDPEAVTHTKEKLFLERLEAIEPIEEVVAFAREVARSSPVCVVSGGLRNVVQQTLKNIGVEDLFPLVITPADVETGKPAPDMFLLAAEKMNVHPRRCLVLEDGISGIQGAAAAGMSVYYIPRLPAAGASRH